MPEIEGGEGVENINLVIPLTLLKIRAFQMVIKLKR
jgi:hypothetical protein